MNLKEFLASIENEADCNKLALITDFAEHAIDNSDAAEQITDLQHALAVANETIGERDAEVATLKANAPQP